jgi:hypothetical protein
MRENEYWFPVLTLARLSDFANANPEKRKVLFVFCGAFSSALLPLGERGAG